MEPGKWLNVKLLFVQAHYKCLLCIIICLYTTFFGIYFSLVIVCIFSTGVGKHCFEARKIVKKRKNMKNSCTCSFTVNVIVCLHKLSYFKISKSCMLLNISRKVKEHERDYLTISQHFDVGVIFMACVSHIVLWIFEYARWIIQAGLRHQNFCDHSRNFV